jgi:DeoR family ulaG and ulaABCDEF operon transcriptional repressor
MFIGAAGVSAAGLLQTDVILLKAERRLMARTRAVILLVDSSKFAPSRGQAVCTLDKIDTVITDDGITSAHADMIRRAGATLIAVSADSL